MSTTNSGCGICGITTMPHVCYGGRPVGPHISGNVNTRIVATTTPKMPDRPDLDAMEQHVSPDKTGLIGTALPRPDAMWLIAYARSLEAENERLRAVEKAAREMAGDLRTSTDPSPAEVAVLLSAGERLRRAAEKADGRDVRIRALRDALREKGADQTVCERCGGTGGYGSGSGTDMWMRCQPCGGSGKKGAEK